jgi:integrase
VPLCKFFEDTFCFITCRAKIFVCTSDPTAGTRSKYKIAKGLNDSKAGKPRHVVLTDEGQRLFASLTAGKLRSDPIFTRRDGGMWGKSHQLRPMLEACKRAKINPAISFHVLRHTHGSTLAMRGVPMGVIAEQLGHADTRMTAKHYAHLAPSYVADTIRANFPTLGIAGDPTVVSMKR